MSQSTPKTLGKYQIIREIARSNDIVYEAYDSLMNRRVALKELNIPSSSTDAQRSDRVKRFQREVKAAGSLQHPGIVTIYEYGEEPGHAFMAMEYLDGKTLRNELDTKGLLPLDRALKIAIEVLEALEYAHQHGVIHRDMKPENIQILSSGQIKLTDFGIARLVFEPNITMDGQVFGTPSYMSPEQIIGKDLDARTDIFSVGSLLYEMIEGHKAFQGDNVISISYAITHSDPAPANQANSQVQQILKNALEKTVALRYASAADFCADCKAALQGLSQPVLGNLPTVMPTPAYMPPQAYPGAMPPPPVQASPPYQYGYQVPQNMGPIYVPTPIYVARPVLPPLITANGWRVIRLVTVTVIVVSLLIGILYVTANTMGKAITDIQHKSILPTTQRPSGESVGSPNNGPIPNAESARPTVDAAAASAAIQRGAELMREAQNETDPDLSLRAWRGCADAYKEASQLSPNPEDVVTLRDGAATALYNAAVRSNQLGRRRDARQMLYEARDLAKPGSEAERAILSLLESLGAN